MLQKKVLQIPSPKLSPPLPPAEDTPWRVGKRETAYLDERNGLSLAEKRPFSERETAFLYEPNASIMKAGCFDEVAQRYGVSQVAQNSHLFVADERIKDFPGRTFLIDTITSMNKRELKAALDGISQANIAVRNFPLSVAELRKRLKLSEGGSTYIFATTLASDDRVLLVCRKPID